MQVKSRDEMRLDALIMLTAKAAEGCSPCLDGYQRAARAAGATDKEITIAINSGKRAYGNVLKSYAFPEPLQSMQGQQSGATAAVLSDGEGEQFIERALADANVTILDAHFRKQGYAPVMDKRWAARYTLGERTCSEAHLPYQLDDDHTAYIDYHFGRNGADVVGVYLDFTGKTVLEGWQEPHESVIVSDAGAVVSGHACDTNCFKDNILQCCGGAAIGCLTTVGFELACLTVVCGACAAFECFVCGCC